MSTTARNPETLERLLAQSDVELLEAWPPVKKHKLALRCHKRAPIAQVDELPCWNIVNQVENNIAEQRLAA